MIIPAFQALNRGEIVITTGRTPCAEIDLSCRPGMQMSEPGLLKFKNIQDD